MTEGMESQLQWVWGSRSATEKVAMGWGSELESLKTHWAHGLSQWGERFWQVAWSGGDSHFVVQSLICFLLFATPYTAARQAWSSLRLKSIELVDAIQPSPPLSSPSLPAFNLSQHQGLFQWANSLHQVAKVLELQLQHQSFQWIFRIDFLSDLLIGSPCSPRDLQESSPAPPFKSINSLALSFLYSPTLTSIREYWKNHSFN